MSSNFHSNASETLADSKSSSYPSKPEPYKPSIAYSQEFPSRVILPTNRVTSDSEEFGDDDFSFQGKSMGVRAPEKAKITHWRRVDQDDLPAIVNLIEKSGYVMDALFNVPDVPNLIEKSSFSIVQFNSEGALVSFTSAFAYPNVPAVPSFDWYLWLAAMYNVEEATPRNTFFIHYMIWDADYYHDFLRLTLETMFMEYVFLKNVIITRPPNVKIPSIYAEYFVQVLPADAKNYDCEQKSLQLVLLCLRHLVMERLKIRLAIVEDHDDLMPIIERQSSRLRELYGDFCMAELIEYPGTEDRKTLVCESMGYAVGLMSLNKAIDLELLNSQFDLGVFHGLRKPDSRDKKSAEMEEDDQREIYIPDKVDSSLDIIDSEVILQLLNWKPSLCARGYDLESEESDDKETGLSRSTIRLIKKSPNAKLIPKFSAYALSAIESVAESFEEVSLVSDRIVEKQSSIASEMSDISLQHFNLPEYHGPTNAFAIEMYAMHEDFDERLCADFLIAAFEVFPDAEYCIMTVTSQCPVFPLLDYFMRVTPRPLKRFKQELYVCHKSSILSHYMRVRRLEKSDMDEVYELLNGITKQRVIFADIANSCFLEDSAYQGFVLVCDKAIVGVAVLCNEDGMEYLAHHYHVSDLINFELHKIDYHAVLKHLVLSPIYQTHARFFLRDIMRMADITSLYRARYEESQGDWLSASLITVLGQFVPVKPRRMVKYHLPSLKENIPPSYFLNYDKPFALYHINSRICGLKKYTSNVNLVIVGASRTAVSFLEHILFAPSAAYVTYNNITWVSPHGIGTEDSPHPARDLMFPYRGKYSRRYKAQMNLRTYVNVVYGTMTEINRVEKYIVINNDAILRYDYLILLCGKQFSMPVPIAQEPDVRKCRRKYRPRCSLFKFLVTQKESKDEVHKTVKYPPNVFIINTHVDANNTLISLQYLIAKRKGVESNEKIIVYGHNINAYLCIQGLLKFGISSDLIVFVEPFPLGIDSVNFFKDPNVDKAAIDAISELNVEHYRGYVLYDWLLCENNQVKIAVFHSKFRKIALECLAMIPFDKKLVSDVTFKASNEASLVYDNKLVINRNFRTNDPYIYAAGPFTKYQRRYYADDKCHQYYSSDEVGELLADVIRNKIDPTVDPDPDKPSDTVPKMAKPIMIFGQLPGDWNYFDLRSPGRGISFETDYTVPEYGDVLTTGDCKMSKGYGYFTLKLDDFGFVRSIICFTKDEIDSENLMTLYGKHERCLNNLLVRFDLGLIPDFYAYFREPWVYALYHDRFPLLMEENQEIFNDEKPGENQEKIVDYVVKALQENDWKRLNNRKLNEIKEKFENTEVKTQIQQNLLDFLLYFDEAFPMYATPRIVRVLLHGAGTSILHKLPVEEHIPRGYKPPIKTSESL